MVGPAYRPGPIRRLEEATPKRRQLVGSPERGSGSDPTRAAHNTNTGDDNSLGSVPALHRGWPRGTDRIRATGDPQRSPRSRQAGGAGRRGDRTRRYTRSAAGGRSSTLLLTSSREPEAVNPGHPATNPARDRCIPGAEPSSDNSITPTSTRRSSAIPDARTTCNANRSLDRRSLRDGVGSGFRSTSRRTGTRTYAAATGHSIDFGSDEVSGPTKGYIFQRMLEGRGVFYK